MSMAMGMATDRLSLSLRLSISLSIQSPFFCYLLTVRRICHKQKNGDKPVHTYVHMLGSNISVQYI